MASKLFIRHQNKTLLPVSANATYEVTTVADNYQYDVYVQFLDASSNPVTPAAGTVNVYGQPFSGMLLEATGSPVTASSVNVGVSSYTPPTITGMCDKIQVKFTGITGAQFAKVCVYRKV